MEMSLSTDFNNAFQSAFLHPFGKVTCNFRLRNKGCANYTSILCVIYVNGMQFAFPIGAKITPFLWDAKAQRAKVGIGLTESENKYNLNTNNIISHFIGLFDTFKMYLCARTFKDSEIKSLIIKHFNLNRMGRKKKQSATLMATDLLKRAFRKYYYEGEGKGAKESSKNQMEDTDLKRISTFVTEKGIEDNLALLSQRGYNELRAYVIEKEFGYSSMNSTLSLFSRLINKVLCIDNEFSNYGFTPIAHSAVKKLDTISKKVELLDSEIKAIESLDLSKNITTHYARLQFLTLCDLGQRQSDFKAVWDAYNKGEEWNAIETKKESTDAVLHFTAHTNSLLEQFPKDYQPLEYGSYLYHLKKIGKLANLNRVIEWTEQKGLREVKFSDTLANIISTHYARHTFVTTAYREGGLTTTEIAQFTGHKSIDVIEKVYLHRNKEDKINAAKATLQRKKEGNGIVKPIAVCEPTNLDEIRRILAVLGADSTEIMDKTEEELNRLLYGVKESELLKIGIPLELIKKIYNQGGTLKERKETLEEVIREFKSQLN